METGRVFQSGVAMMVSIPRCREAVSFFIRAMSVSDQWMCSETSSTDCRPAFAAISSFSSKLPFSVHTMTDVVFFA
jgi:hypothetical protein